MVDWTCLISDLEANNLKFTYIYIRVPCFCYEGLPLVAFWRFYCINLVYELISPLIDNTVQQATQMFIILLKTKKLKIVEDDIFNVLVQKPTRVQRP